MPLEMISSLPEGSSLHRSLHRIAKSGLRFLLAFVAPWAKLPVLSGTFETQRVVAGTVGEPPTHFRQLLALVPRRIVVALRTHVVAFRDM